MQGPGASFYANELALKPAPEPSRKVFIASLVCFALIAGVLDGIVPRFADVFDAVDVPMPGLTTLLLTISRVFSVAWPLYIAMAMLASWRLRCVPHADVILVLGMGAFTALAVIALFLPLTNCTQGIGRMR